MEQEEERRTSISAKVQVTAFVDVEVNSLDAFLLLSTPDEIKVLLGSKMLKHDTLNVGNLYSVEECFIVMKTIHIVTMKPFCVCEELPQLGLQSHVNRFYVFNTAECNCKAADCSEKNKISESFFEAGDCNFVE